MKTKPDPMSDNEIVSMIKVNSYLGWIYLYDKYANMMFGIILKITSDHETAKKILIKSFTQLKADNLIPNNKAPLYIYLLTYTCITAHTVLMNSNKNGKVVNGKKEFSILNCVMENSGSLQNLSEIHSLRKEDINMKLREQFNLLRGERV